MLKGLEMRAASQQAKAVASAPVRRSVLVTARAPASKHHQAFKSAKRVAVLTSAADTGAAATTSKAQKISLQEIQAGTEYEGKVVKVEAYGAFVDIGASTNGLVHISQLSDKFVKNASSIVQVGQSVRVRVLSVDAAGNRVALSMKSLESAAPAEQAEDAEDVEEEEDAFEGEEDVEAVDEAPEGFEYVTADDAPEFRFLMADDDEEMTLEGVAQFEAMDAEQVERVFQREGRSNVPVGELVTGKVTRVEEYGVFVEFEYEGNQYTALLEKDEAKVPAASLSPEQLSAFVQEGEPTPEYVDMDIDSNTSIGSYYQPGQTVTAFVLDVNEKGLSLTHWADWEVDAAVREVAEYDDELGTVAADIDILAEDPLDLIEDEEGGPDSGAAAAAAEALELSSGDGATADIRAEVASLTGAYGRPLVNAEDLRYSFPSRPLSRVNQLGINGVSFKDTDFDGDEVELADFWQEQSAFAVPKGAMRRLGLKVQFSESGEPQVVKREGKEARDFDVQSTLLGGSRKARVAAIVKDLLADEEDEAELPSRAARRPVVLAAAVQNISAATVKDLRNKTGAGMMDCKKALAENEGDVEKAIEWLRKKGLAGADKKAGRVAAEGAIASYIHPGSRLGVLLEVNCETDFVAASDKFQGLVNELGMIIASCPDVSVVSPEDVPPEVLAKERDVEMGKEDIKSKPEAVRAKIVEGRVQKIRDNMALLNQDSLRDPTKKVSEIIKETVAAVGENIQVRRFIRFNLGEGIEKRSADFAAEVAQAAAAAPAPPKKEEPKKEEQPAAAAPAKPAVQVSASVVKQLRDKTGAGMMDCKKALGENGGDMDAAVEWLRKKGLAGADKKAGRVAAEGAIACYIHPGSRLGVLLEVNCETDFVAAGDQFNSLVNSVAMQIAASPGVQYVTAEEIPPEVYAREKEIEMGREDLKNKPDAIRAKIAEGRVAKLAQEMALLPQPYLMDPSKTVEQAVKEAVAACGEKISVRRFIKFTLGEGIEKKKTDLAAEVAAVTGKA